MTNPALYSAETRLTGAEIELRPKLAFNGFFYAHIPILLDVVFIAVGLESMIEDAFEPLGLRHYSSLFSFLRIQEEIKGIRILV